jgi:hypothetical protein
MADYTPITNFAVKDTLPSGDTLKRAKGADIQAELNSISSAVNSKVDTSGLQIAVVDIDLDGGTY